MSTECDSVISAYKDKITIVKMPKKGGTGLTDSLDHICQLAGLKARNDNLEEFKNSFCY
jgi:glycine reductase